MPPTRLVALLRGASSGDAGGGISLPRNGAPGLLRQTFPLQPPSLHLPVRVSGLAGRRTDPRALTRSNEAHPGVIIDRTSSDWLRPKTRIGSRPVNVEEIVQVLAEMRIGTVTALAA